MITRTIVAAAAGLLAASTLPAAAIQCDGPYQIIGGGQTVASLYCQEQNLARVARGSYGMSTSVGQLRGSESEKQSVCSTIGHDSRVADICQKYRYDGDSYRIR